MFIVIVNVIIILLTLIVFNESGILPNLPQTWVFLWRIWILPSPLFWFWFCFCFLLFFFSSSSSASVRVLVLCVFLHPSPTLQGHPSGPHLSGPRPFGALPPDGPKFRSLFFPSPQQFSFFLPSLGCLLVEFWWCFFLNAGTLLGPPGLHTTARELQTCTLEGPGLQTHHQNSTRRHPERDKKGERTRSSNRIHC